MSATLKEVDLEILNDLKSRNITRPFIKCFPSLKENMTFFEGLYWMDQGDFDEFMGWGRSERGLLNADFKRFYKCICALENAGYYRNTQAYKDLVKEQLGRPVDAFKIYEDEIEKADSDVEKAKDKAKSDIQKAKDKAESDIQKAKDKAESDKVKAKKKMNNATKDKCTNGKRKRNK